MSQTAPYRKSGFFNNRIMNPLLVALGITPIVRIRGRKSGKLYTMPVLPLEFQGKRYLVAPRGDTHWARNLRAAGSGDLRWKGRTERFTATEIEAARRRPLVDAYVRENGARYGGFVAKEFAALPNPEDHPVFLIEAAPGKA
ncbi:MAG TPA: nitroreductase/quinone reductase family protein [Candidatus Dormibacteraeota bacterium]